MFRRPLSRLLRLRNLVLFTIIVIFLYIVKSLSNMDVMELRMPEALQRSPEVLNVEKAVLLPPENDNRIPRKGEYFVPKSMKKKDWHNHTQIEYERKRVGIGEQGKPAYMPKEESDLEEKLYSVNGFNGALSDKIPLNRSLPDIRHKGCKTKKYLESLPTVSVVVPFHNEHWSTLLRTAYSVLYRSPKHLIKEVFLVDDASTKDFLKDKLDEYLSANMPKVKVVRLKERSGLITARLAGARRATADVLIFLDSHTEANVNWLPPLLEPIALNYRTVVCPFIDVVAFDSFEYRAQDEGARGAFDWEFFYKRLPVLPQDEKNMPEPFQSPVMAGGLFAIARAFFWELGGYDPGLDIWGGEQYELSFKIWQCGGRMLDAPCSRVGHIYRKFAPFPNPGRGDFVGRNYRRVAEVWMDEYAQYLYQRRPQYLKIDTGDISEQKALRQRLKCKPFRWFMTQIAFDLTAKYPTVEPNPFGEGHVKPESNPSLCIDAHHGAQMERLQLTSCSDAGEQEFLLSWHKDVRSKQRNMCWDLPDSAPKSPILLYTCHLGGGNQLWKYNPDTKQLKHGGHTNCIDYDQTSHALYINRCDDTSRTQRWLVDKVDRDMIAKWDSFGTRVTAPIEDY
ncbi:N-acetylgalactosaminyltransferase 6 isoform X2 [Manduca sexta]|uniref:Polypeptide N-acetylgalactosaminyltransferase n=3 Tax=Manduca sexta TaxID=7130 RepID=A0A921ZU32_MANSE|nr:N-acetylgalactosaminyltransferase 6 isoform X2 [Manduca sexta]KAG6463705.1 hypothetical protein O3G_MSEX014032 [Manduca sexta]